eukprot:Ihof_evm27s1 gene=Ihof_evmTU27s1
MMDLDVKENTTETATLSNDLQELLDDPKLRFEVEMEFVQLLADPKYLNYLAQQREFEKPEFVNYLKYLTYWKQPAYAKFLRWPQCLYFLDQLQQESFRKAIIEAASLDVLQKQQFFHWRYYYENRMRQ